MNEINHTNRKRKLDDELEEITEQMPQVMMIFDQGQVHSEMQRLFNLVNSQQIVIRSLVSRSDEFEKNKIKEKDNHRSLVMRIEKLEKLERLEKEEKTERFERIPSYIS
jgi:hypothetical protein